MTFDDTPAEAAYRATVRAWIAANAPAQSALDRADRAGRKALAAEWQARKAVTGYACITWPEALGGGGGTAIEQAIFDQEERAAGLAFPYFMTGLKICLPAIVAHGDEAMRRRFLAPALAGEQMWCQLFSEPGSGSDVAGARTRAVRDGEHWVVDGQKVWNSHAHLSDYGLLLARTDAGAPKHAGLTMFWVKMDAPGIDARPLRQMNGDSEFSEVFLNGVRIHDSQRVGAVGEGWRVTLTTLMNERMALNGGSGLGWRELLELARATQAQSGRVADDPAFRARLADWYVTAEGIRLMGLRTLTKLGRGEIPGPESAAGKLLWSNQTQDIANAGIEMLDQFGMIDDLTLAPLDASFQQRLLWAPGLRIGGGTDEILRNIIAERILNLPGDVRVDKGIPFKDIKY